MWLGTEALVLLLVLISMYQCAFIMATFAPHHTATVWCFGFFVHSLWCTSSFWYVKGGSIRDGTDADLGFRRLVGFIWRDPTETTPQRRLVDVVLCVYH